MILFGRRPVKGFQPTMPAVKFLRLNVFQQHCGVIGSAELVKLALTKAVGPSENGSCTTRTPSLLKSITLICQ
jgi:hypothetical protein